MWFVKLRHTWATVVHPYTWFSKANIYIASLRTFIHNIFFIFHFSKRQNCSAETHGQHKPFIAYNRPQYGGLLWRQNVSTTLVNLEGGYGVCNPPPPHISKIKKVIKQSKICKTNLLKRKKRERVACLSSFSL